MRVIALAAMLLLSGCIGGDKLESVCEDIVRSVATDPSGLKVNTIKTTSGTLRTDDLERYFAARYPQGMTENARELLTMRKDEISDTRDIFVQVDYTANERGGVIRDQALCRYIEWPRAGTELVSLTVRNRDYSQDDFMMIFLKYERPKGLSLTYKIE